MFTSANNPRTLSIRVGAFSFHRVTLRILAVLGAATFALGTSAIAHADTANVQTAWRLLDYMAVDYGGAVSGGKIRSASEYNEMTEFAASVSARLATLPQTPERAKLIEGATRLQAVIAAKGAPEEVARVAHGLAADLLKAYPVPLAPSKVPELARGATLFAQNCASCHGMTGDGRGPDAAKLTTPPIAFSELARARQRSPFALYQVIDQGIDGTAMQSFASLPGDDRWALAFYAGRFAFSDAAATEGERLWKADPGLRQRIPDLTALAGLTPETLAKSIGSGQADAVIAYLRRHPEAVVQQAPGSLDVARAKLAQSLAAYRAGDRHAAQELALSAYLDGFEPLEPMLTARDATLMGHIESAMGEFRASLQQGRPADEIATRVQVLGGLFDDADAALSPDAASSASTFLGAFTILLREGLEALLIVVAMIAFLRKAERPEVLPCPEEGEDDEPGPAAALATLSSGRQWLVMGALTIVAAAVILVSAEPFAEAMVGSGRVLGFDEFLLIQWLAPLASEAPAATIAILFVLSGRAANGLATMISDKINQWTLLVGMLPLAMSLGAGSFSALPLDARQHEEFFLTAAQSIFGIALLLRLRLSLWGALALAILFLVQVGLALRFLGGETAAIATLTGLAWAYLALAMIVFIANAKSFGLLLRVGIS